MGQLMVESQELMERGRVVLQLSAAGEPAAIAALAHVGALRTVRQHLVQLRVAETIAAVASQAFVFDEGRLVWCWLGRFDDQPVFPGAIWPLAGLGVAAAALGQEAGRDFPGCGEG